MNAVEIADAVSDLFQKDLDPAEFPFSFLEAFGNKETTVKRLRRGDSNASDVSGGVLQKNNIHLAVCASGKVGTTLSGLRTSPKTAANKVKFILATDGEWLEAEDLRTGETFAAPYAETAGHFGFFLELGGISTVKEIKDNPIDIRATGRLNKLYVELLRVNPDWAGEARRPDMNHFMARLIFCFFAEDTHIFLGDGLFTQTIDQMTQSDGANVHDVVGKLFEAMNLSLFARKKANLPGWADQFPYVNGGLFSGNLEAPRFTRIARSYLLRAGELNWRQINPDIFGSMIQAVADDEERGALGMHYTSVPNILKVLNPLFLDDLRSRLEAAGDSSIKLLNLRKRMARIRVFDPACGSGNFLVIAYKEMRGIEAKINRRRGEVNVPSEIRLTNFRGVEIRDFAAEIARLALIIAEYQCDVMYRGEKLALAEFLPLNEMNWIVCGNALRLDWLSVCPPVEIEVRLAGSDLFSTPLEQAEVEFHDQGGETYICGNPPYLGGKKQDANQKLEMQAVAAGRFNYKNLDYICGFLTKAVDIIRHFERLAFVSTSSINQGIHVPAFWPYVLESGAAIDFCYEPFKWSNSASNNAGVYCTILGLSGSYGSKPPFIYFDGGRREVEHINPYLISGTDHVVLPRSTPISDLSQINTGNQAADGGHLFVSTSEKAQIEGADPVASRLIRRVSGTSEFFDGSVRWCLWIDDEDLPLANSIALIRIKVDSAARFRSEAGEVAQTLVNRPHQFRYRNEATRLGMIVPQVSSETRQYIPSGVFDRELIVTHKAHAIFEATLLDFAIFNSRLHFVWARTLSGRLGNGLSYSSNLSWNTLPLTRLTEQQKSELSQCAEEILLAREAHFPATIADLYDPENMPDDLRRAHECNDETLERIYIGRRFKNDSERLERLFEMYTAMTGSKPVTTKGQEPSTGGSTLDSKI